MKKFIAGILFGVVLCLSPSLIAAASDIKLVINGRDVTSQLDQKPLMINNRIMVPIRAIGEFMNSEVFWDSAVDTVRINSIDLPSPSVDFLSPIPNHKLSNHSVDTFTILENKYKTELDALNLDLTFIPSVDIFDNSVRYNLGLVDRASRDYVFVLGLEYVVTKTGGGVGENKYQPGTFFVSWENSLRAYLRSRILNL